MLCGAVALLQPLAEACKAAVGAELILHLKPKAEEGGSFIDEMIKALRSSNENPLIGVFTKASLFRD